MEKKINKISRTAVIDYLTSLAQDKWEDVSFLQLYLTRRCQLRCSYCRMNTASSKADMSETTMRKAVDLLLTAKERNIRLQLFGGEPLLRFDLIQKTTAYLLKRAKEADKVPQLLIATNGALLAEQHYEFFKKYDFCVVFSMDGKASVQKNNRPPSAKKDSRKTYLKTLDNLKILAGSGIRYFVNAVIQPQDISRIDETVNFFIKRGARHIRLSYRMGVFWTKKNMEGLLDEVEKIFLECRKDHPDVEIRACKDEPVIISSGLAVTAEKDIFVGTTLPLTYKFPHLKDINYYGNLDSLKDIDLVKRNRRIEVQNALKRLSSHSHEFELLANNIYLGLLYEKLFKKLTSHIEDPHD